VPKNEKPKTHKNTWRILNSYKIRTQDTRQCATRRHEVGATRALLLYVLLYSYLRCYCLPPLVSPPLFEFAVEPPAAVADATQRNIKNLLLIKDTDIDTDTAAKAAFDHHDDDDNMMTSMTFAAVQ